MFAEMLLVAATPIAVDPAQWLRFPDYPLSSIKRGEAGVVSYRLTVGSDGRVTNCVVTETSGYAHLDRETCKMLAQKARFASGEGDETGYDGSMAWSLPPERLFSNVTAATLSVSKVPAGLTGPMRLKVGFDAMGAVAKCSADRPEDTKFAVAICPALAGERLTKPPKAVEGTATMAIRYYQISLVGR